jgi:hypothetical protein
MTHIDGNDEWDSATVMARYGRSKPSLVLSGTWICTAILLVLSVLSAYAQQSEPATANSLVPLLVNFSGTLTDVDGKPLTGVAGVTFYLFKDSQGGAPLWMETQNVHPNSAGRYTVMLGSTSSTGLPTDLFSSGDARWLAVQVQGQAEQPRVLLLSVPYALKALDAETIHGMPLSAFVLANQANTSSGNATTAAAANSVSSSGVVPNAASNVTTTGGTASIIPMFTTATNIQNSILTQTGTTGVNIRGSLNLPATGTATAAAGKNSQLTNWTASVFNGLTSTPVPQNFFLQAEPANNDTASASGTLNLLFSQGTGVPAETGLKIASNGRITFAPGQTFPGSGSVKSVGLSAPATDFTVSGSPVTSTGTLAFAWKVIPTSTDVGNAIVKRDASGSFSAGTGSFAGNLAAGGTVSGAAGSFTSNVGVGGNLSVSGTISGNGSGLTNVVGVLVGQLLGNTSTGPVSGYLNMISNYIPPVNVRAFTMNRCSWSASAAGQELSFRSAIRNPSGGALIIGNAFYLFPTSAGTETIYNENNDWFDLTAGQSYDFGMNIISSPGGIGTCSTVVQLFSR